MMLPETNYSRPNWRWRAVRLLTVAGLLVYAITFGLLVVALLWGNSTVAGRDSGAVLVFLVGVATLLAAIAVYGAFYRRLAWIWAPGVVLLVLAVPWAGFWPMLLGGGFVGLAAALARPEPRPPEDGA